MPSAPTATTEELLAACVAEQSVRLTHQRLRMRWTNYLPFLGVEGLAGHIPWTEADPKLRGHLRPKTYTSCRPTSDIRFSELPPPNQPFKRECLGRL